jgi:hypothetical protein
MTMTTARLAADLRALAHARRELALKKEAWGALFDQLRGEYAELLGSIEHYTTTVAALETELRTEAHDVPTETLPPGLKHRSKQVCDYDDADVIAWAQEHMPLFVSVVTVLDRKPFEALLKNKPDLCPVATVHIEHEVTIARNLEALLAPTGEDA